MEETQILSDLEMIRENLRDESISLLSDAVYRKQENAKSLERQCAKVARAVEKAIHEYQILEKMRQAD